MASKTATTRNKIGTNFRRARIARGFTQPWVARQLGVTQSAVSEWESGKRVPAGDVVARIARLYGVTTDSLLS